MATETSSSSGAQLLLAPEQLRHRLDPAMLPFATTAEVPPLADSIGQLRAIDAMAFGLEMRAFGYNLYVAGAPGSGRERTTRAFLEQLAPQRPAPDDWVYVFNFVDPDQPRALRLPAGRGAAFVHAMDVFVASAQQQLARAFAGEEFEQQKAAVLAPFERERERVFGELREFAERFDFALKLTPMGIAGVPRIGGRQIAEGEFAQLTEAQQQDIQQRGESVQHAVANALREVRELEQQANLRLHELSRAVTAYTLDPLLDDLEAQYGASPDVRDYLTQVRQDIPEHLEEFRAEEEASPPAGPLPAPAVDVRLLRYRVNLLVDNSAAQGAPIIIERNPTYYNLAGRIDYRSTFGAMVTDFRQIKAGALHRANGGFLVLHILDVLANPFAWDALKRALMNQAIRIENLGEQYTPLPSAGLRPMPIPLDVKVILIGPVGIYHLIYQVDEDFREVFRIKADFAPDMPWDDKGVAHYSAFISRCVQESGLRHFDRAAVAQVIEQGARRCEDQRRLSTQLLEIATMVLEANYWAGKAGHTVVEAADVAQAVAKRAYRSNLVEERIQDLMRDGTIMVDTTGARVGQINGLSIINLGDYEFGRPTRVTAQAALGSGTLQSIDREVKLAGPIHAKGFLTLSSYLTARYAQEWPLAVSASLIFEQSYDEIEGDSAASAELYALLSALADVPIRQGIAVTGSVNQHGEVQAVGGVTRKIEGFFDVCKARGLTGDQGVIIPRANAPHLMLNEEVVAAAAADQFHIWAVETIDEGIEILTGVPAGAREPDGGFTPGSIHARVEARLKRYAEQHRAFAAGPQQARHNGASSP